VSAPVCRLESSREGGVDTLRVVGELDSYSSPELRDCLESLVAQGSTRVVVDLTDVVFADSTAMGVLVGALKRLRAVDGDLVLKHPQPPVMRLMKLTGLDTIFTLI
jgi:anti-sigma B factor antagonist